MKYPQPNLWHPVRNTEKMASVPSSDKERLLSRPHSQSTLLGCWLWQRCFPQIKRWHTSQVCLLCQPQDWQSIKATSALSPLNPHPSSGPLFSSFCFSSTSFLCKCASLSSEHHSLSVSPCGCMFISAALSVSLVALLLSLPFPN